MIEVVLDLNFKENPNERRGFTMSKDLIIDFLFLDLNVCQRCQGTELALIEALDQSAIKLRNEGYKITLNKINVSTEALAKYYRFISSPTIRVNGKDIAKDLYENTCEDCGDLCGTSVLCRVWKFQGRSYPTPPIELIKEALIKNQEFACLDNEVTYEIPENLKRFYRGLSSKNNYPTITIKHL